MDLKRNIQECIFQYRVFTKNNHLSSLSKAFSLQEHKNHLPLYRVKNEICRRMPRNLFSSAQFQRKKLGLLSIYKFSLDTANKILFLLFVVPISRGFVK
jgi:hypothetical protein